MTCSHRNELAKLCSDLAAIVESHPEKEKVHLRKGSKKM
jgi:hypothetical protein